jgi:hypothetical protein
MIDRRALPVRTTPRGVFGALVRCECGHGIGAHTRNGCGVCFYSACACRLSDGAALERAIERATQDPNDRRNAGSLVALDLIDEVEDVRE